jgi:hypothetical protein
MLGMVQAGRRSRLAIEELQLRIGQAPRRFRSFDRHRRESTRSHASKTRAKPPPSELADHLEPSGDDDSGPELLGARKLLLRGLSPGHAAQERLQRRGMRIVQGKVSPPRSIVDCAVPGSSMEAPRHYPADRSVRGSRSTSLIPGVLAPPLSTDGIARAAEPTPGMVRSGRGRAGGRSCSAAREWRPPVGGGGDPPRVWTVHPLLPRGARPGRGPGRRGVLPVLRGPLAWPAGVPSRRVGPDLGLHAGVARLAPERARRVPPSRASARHEEISRLAAEVRSSTACTSDPRRRTRWRSSGCS